MLEELEPGFAARLREHRAKFPGMIFLKKSFTCMNDGEKKKRSVVFNMTEKSEINSTAKS